jgi:hypothetical protein
MRYNGVVDRICCSCSPSQRSAVASTRGSRAGPWGLTVVSCPSHHHCWTVDSADCCAAYFGVGVSAGVSCAASPWSRVVCELMHAQAPPRL